MGASAAPDAAAPAPMTRRELRRLREEQERAQAESSASESSASASMAATTGRRSAHAAPTEPDSRDQHRLHDQRPSQPQSTTSPIRIPILPLAAPTRQMPLVASAPASVASPKGGKRVGRFGRQGFVLLGMAFAGAMAFATSVPANAVLSSADNAAVANQTQHAASAHTTATKQMQTLRADGAPVARVSRDGVKVESREQIAEVSNLRLGDTFTNDPNGTIQWPFMVGVPIASYFGPRIAPMAGASTFHEGVDFDPGFGAPIQAIADGVVRTVDPYNDNGLGVHIIIDHMIDGKLVSSLYGHMKPGSPRVTVGQHVKVGQIIGNVGDTGISTGAHLHFEILLNGTQPVDPYAWLKQNAN